MVLMSHCLVSQNEHRTYAEQHNDLFVYVINLVAPNNIMYDLFVYVINIVVPNMYDLFVNVINVVVPNMYDLFVCIIKAKM